MKILLLLITILSLNNLPQAQQKQIISKSDLEYLKGLTRAVLDSSKIFPNQKLPAPFGHNSTGGTLIRPGGRDTYPAFWIRDYAMSLETGFVTAAEQKHMLLLTAATQCDQTWITKGGSMVPYGAIADHIRVENSVPVYFPGTYDVEEQGTPEFGLFPPYCDQFFFIKMAHHYVKSTGDISVLIKEIQGTRLIDRLETAFRVPPAHTKNDIVYTIDNFRGVDFGFRDAIQITGDLVYPSLLKYIAALELSELFTKMRNKNKAAVYTAISKRIKAAIPTIFLAKNGMLNASTNKSAQPDVWATALAVYYGVLKGESAIKAALILDSAYRKGLLAYKGNIRHIIKSDDFNEHTAWEGAVINPVVNHTQNVARHNQYQNGAYWGTPLGWVVYTIAICNPESARQLVKEYIQDLKANDYRKGSTFSGPYECLYPPLYTRGPVYLTTVSSPYIVLHAIADEK